MNHEQLKQQWLKEEENARIIGWDFSYLSGRYEEENDLPWDYRALVLERLNKETDLLDMETGGGEFLLSLNHPYHRTTATEGYPPNIKVCENTLLPLGIDFKAADGEDKLPFPDGRFDLIINRHGSYNIDEIKRTLREGGAFITQQVGAFNDRELTDLLLPGTPLPYPDQRLDKAKSDLESAGFQVVQAMEAFRPIKFYDTGALVWFAKIIEWEFPGFSVEKCFDRLLEAERQVRENGHVAGRIHRYCLVAEKKTG